MERIEAILRSVDAIDDATVDQAIAAALPSADAVAVRHMVPILLRRGREVGRAALIAQYHRLASDDRQRVQQAVTKLGRALRAASEQSERAAENALELIADARAADLAYLAAALLRSGPSIQRHAAANCLLRLADRAMGTTGSDEGIATPPADASDVSQIRAAVTEAIDLFDKHDQSSVVRAACALLPLPITPMSKSAGRSDARLTRALQSMLRDTTDVRIRRAAPLLLTVPTLRKAATQTLDRLCGVKAWQDVWHFGHLLALPSSRDALARVETPDRLLPDAKTIAETDTATARWAPLWIDALRVPPVDGIACLEALADHAHPAARLAAARRLIEMSDRDPSEAPADALAAFCNDADPRIARIAVRHLMRRDWSKLPTLLPTLAKHNDAGLRAMAQRRLAPLAFSRFWTAWPNMKAEQQLAAGRALIKIDPHFHRHLADHLSRPDAKQRLRAINIISTLNQGQFFAAALVTLAESDDPHTVSAAVAALGSARTTEAETVLTKSLNHGDARVRANAIEALQRAQTTQHVQQLLTMAREDDNRPRANAIRALLDMSAGDALDALGHMLHDADAAHRASALWLVETMGILNVAHDVTEMAVSDNNADVRKRARRVVNHLIQSLRGEAHIGQALDATLNDTPLEGAA